VSQYEVSICPRTFRSRVANVTPNIAVHQPSCLSSRQLFMADPAPLFPPAPPLPPRNTITVRQGPGWSRQPAVLAHCLVSLSSIARWPKFLPKNLKEPGKNKIGRKNIWPNFTKSGRKGAKENFLEKSHIYEY
jgi:hypothetical protein